MGHIPHVATVADDLKVPNPNYTILRLVTILHIDPIFPTIKLSIA
jgi:hypothetical protein